MVDADMETAKKEAHMNSYNSSNLNVERVGRQSPIVETLIEKSELVDRYALYDVNFP